SSQVLPVDSGEVKLDDEPPNSGGGSPCEAGEEGEGGVCLNGGVCSVVDDQAVCDCSRTGFRGKDCSQEIKFSLQCVLPMLLHDNDQGKYCCINTAKPLTEKDNNVEGLAHLMMGDQGKSKEKLEIFRWIRKDFTNF
ncbi:NRXN1 isoform 23, partial [Pongo abelii]